MKTTIDIPDALYRQAKVRAAQQGITLREMVVKALDETLLQRSGTAAPPAVARSLFKVNHSGFPVLTGRTGVTVSNEQVNRIRAEEGI